MLLLFYWLHLTFLGVSAELLEQRDHIAWVFSRVRGTHHKRANRPHKKRSSHPFPSPMVVVLKLLSGDAHSNTSHRRVSLVAVAHRLTASHIVHGELAGLVHHEGHDRRGNWVCSASNADVLPPDYRLLLAQLLLLQEER